MGRNSKDGVSFVVPPPGDSASELLYLDCADWFLAAVAQKGEAMVIDEVAKVCQGSVGRYVPCAPRTRIHGANQGAASLRYSHCAATVVFLVKDVSRHVHQEQGSRRKGGHLSRHQVALAALCLDVRCHQMSLGIGNSPFLEAERRFQAGDKRAEVEGDEVSVLDTAELLKGKRGGTNRSAAAVNTSIDMADGIVDGHFGRAEEAEGQSLLVYQALTSR